MNITLNPFDVKSIDNAIRMVEQLSKETLDKIDALIHAMVVEGETVAMVLCLPAETGDTQMSITRESKVEGARTDAVGYIIPDNDYSMRLLDGHYHETLSLGDETGSTLIKSFMALQNELK